MNFNKAMKNLEQKFTSGNDIPVTRAIITAEEYKAIRNTFVESTNANDFIKTFKELQQDIKNLSRQEKE